MVGLDDVLLRLLRLGLGTTKDANDLGEVDYAVLVEAMRRQVVPQVLRAAGSVGLAADATSLARTLELEAARRGPEAEAMAWRVHRLLVDAGTRPLVVKGVALAALTGRSAAERAGTDTDVLVRPGDWPAAHDVLVNAGYQLDQTMVIPRRRDSLTNFVAFTCNEAAYRGPGGAIDVHWRLGPGHVAGLSASALAARAVTVTVAGGEIATLDPDAALAHVALHGAKDRWQSLRTLVDAYLLVTVAGASWSAAAALTGRSRMVAEARCAVEAALETCGSADGQPFTRPARDERLLAYLTRRSMLTPSAASIGAVTAKAALPPQLLVRSRLPRPVWWLTIVPRLGAAAARRVGREAAHLVPRRATVRVGE